MRIIIGAKSWKCVISSNRSTNLHWCVYQPCVAPDMQNTRCLLLLWVFLFFF